MRGDLCGILLFRDFPLLSLLEAPRVLRLEKDLAQETASLLALVVRKIKKSTHFQC